MPNLPPPSPNFGQRLRVVGSGSGGVLSGHVRVGGGFLMTPLLLLHRHSPAVAVATEAKPDCRLQLFRVLPISAGARRPAHGHGADARRPLWGPRSGRDLQLPQGTRSGRFAGALCYVVFLGVVGGLMFVESLRALRRAQTTNAPPTPMMAERMPRRPHQNAGSPRM
jgi:hypothetical protein